MVIFGVRVLWFFCCFFKFWFYSSEFSVILLSVSFMTGIEDLAFDLEL